MTAILRSPNRLVAAALGVAFAGYGAVAAVTGRPALGILFTLAGLVLMVTARLGIAPARRANTAAGAVWLALGYAGLFLVGTDANPLDLRAIDEVVLFAAATVQLAVGLGARRDVTAASPSTPAP